ncbi:ABC transporter permease [Patescibacteria group bacterium]|nr:ABC transporter permease [Patescibacteria group bacterium]
MDIQELILSAIQALRTNLSRTLLTMLGIIIGISSVILIFSIGQGAVAYVTHELSSFGTNFFQINPGTSAIGSISGGANSLTLDDVDAIRNDTSLTNIESVGAFAMVSAVVSANDTDKTLLIYGMTPEILEMLKPEPVDGRFITADDNENMQRVAVIGDKVTETFFGKDADPVGQKIKIDKRTFKIIGIARSGSVLFGSFFDNTVFIPLNVALHEIEGNVRINEIDISVKDTNLINDTMESVTTLLRDRHNLKPTDENDFIMSSATDAISTIQTITNLLTLMVAAISAISLIVGGVGVMNIMLVSVTERTREIGLLKAIGALERDILMQFLIESMVMTGIGGILGILLGITFAFVVTLIVGIPLVIVPEAIVAAVLVSMTVGVVFGLYPARRAARLSPIDALRYE